MTRPIATVVRGWVKDNNKETGIGAGTHRLWRICSLPRTDPGHRQESVHTNGPWITASGRSWCRKTAGEIAPVSGRSV